MKDTTYVGCDDKGRYLGDVEFGMIEGNHAVYVM